MEKTLSPDEVREFLTSNLHTMRLDLLQFEFQLAAHPTCDVNFPPHVPAPVATHPQTGQVILDKDSGTPIRLAPGQYAECARCHWQRRVDEQRAAIVNVEKTAFVALPEITSHKEAPEAPPAQE